MFLNKCLINIVFFLFLIISKLSFSAVYLEDMPKLGDQLLQGFLALESGLLENIRFNGNYGPEKNQYLCHYILNQEQRTRDCPQDHTTALLQNIFPSVGGAALGPINATSDFFNRLKINQIKEILKLYEEIKLNPNNTKNLDKFMPLNSAARRSILPNWKNKFESYDELAEKYKEMFLGAAAEREAYPNIVEYALLGLAIKKANKIEDLKIFGVLDNENIYDKNLYINFETDYIKDNKLYSSDFKNLLEDDPKLFSFYLAGYKKYHDDYKLPPILGENEQAVYNNTKFTACGETALRNFLNIMAADTKDETFNPDYLVGASPELKEFYAKQKTYEDLKSDDLRNAWASLVADKKEVKYEKNTCEISAGMDNMLKLVANLFDDEELKNIENITPQERANKVKYLLNKLSREDFKVSIIADSLNNIDVLDIFINNRKMFVWNFQGGHFYFKHVDELSSSDWRNGHLDDLLNSNIDDNFKRLMGEFFNPFKVVSEKMRDDKNFGYRYSREFKPGKGLVTEEIKNTNNISQIIDLMPYLLRQKLPETFLNNAFEQKTHQEEIFNILLDNPNIDVNLQNKNKNTALYLALKNGNQKIATLLLAKENIDVNLQDRDGNTALHLALQKNNLEIVKLILAKENIDVNLPNNNKNTALHLALQENKLEVVKFLLAKENINVNLQNRDGNTALHFAVEKNNLEIVKLILAKENIDVNLQNKNRETALHLIAANREGKNITLQLLYKANINTKLYNNKSETALDIAKKINNYEVSEALEYFIRTHKR